MCIFCSKLEHVVLRLRASDMLEVERLLGFFGQTFTLFYVLNEIFIEPFGLTLVFCFPQASGNHTFVQLK